MLRRGNAAPAYPCIVQRVRERSTASGQLRSQVQLGNETKRGGLGNEEGSIRAHPRHPWLSPSFPRTRVLGWGGVFASPARYTPPVIGPLLPQVARNVQAVLRFGSVVITMPPGCGVEPELCHFLLSTVKALQAEGLCGTRQGG
jgi:hypothetical protein